MPQTKKYIRERIRRRILELLPPDPNLSTADPTEISGSSA